MEKEEILIVNAPLAATKPAVDVVQLLTLDLWLDRIMPRRESSDAAPTMAKLRKRTEDGLKELRAQLLGPSPTTLERLLVERIVILHVALYYEDHRLAINSEDNHEAAALLHGRVQRLEKRYLAAIRALAEIRRLELPTVQFNVAQQQLVVGNVAVHAGD